MSNALMLSYFAQIHMELKIRNVRESDFGAYRCIAKNPRGSTDGEITLTGTIV